jgi:hypothetical protein
MVPWKKLFLMVEIGRKTRFPMKKNFRFLTIALVPPYGPSYEKKSIFFKVFRFSRKHIFYGFRGRETRFRPLKMPKMRYFLTYSNFKKIDFL